MVVGRQGLVDARAVSTAAALEKSVHGLLLALGVARDDRVGAVAVLHKLCLLVTWRLHQATCPGARSFVRLNSAPGVRTGRRVCGGRHWDSVGPSPRPDLLRLLELHCRHGQWIATTSVPHLIAYFI